MGVSAWFFDPAAPRNCTRGALCRGRRAKKLGFEIGALTSTTRWGSVALIAFRAAADIPDVALARVLRRDGDPGAGALRERILRDRAQVALGDELLERGRVLAGVGVVLVERVAHEQEVFLQ